MFQIGSDLQVEPVGKYLLAQERPRLPHHKTGIWRIYSASSGAILGDIVWHGPWRQYVFWPYADCYFSCGCLRDLTAFMAAKKSIRFPAAKPAGPGPAASEAP